MVDVGVSQLLHLVLVALDLVFCDLFLLLESFETVDRFSADVSDGNSALLGPGVDLLDHFLSSVLSHLREIEPDAASVIDRADSQVTLKN